MRSSQSTLMLLRYLHATNLHCHAVQAIDEVTSTEEEPHLIKEHVFGISNDTIQDHGSVHKVQELIYNNLINYTDYTGCNVIKIHEFGNNCVAQYKSRHCVGDLSCSLANFGYTTVCNFFGNFTR